VSASLHRRGLAAIAIAVFVLAQLATLTHRAAVRHVVCAEHGELVEAPELARTQEAAPGAARLVGVTLGVDADDDHCAIATGIRTHTTPSTPLALVALAPPPVVTERIVAVVRPTVSPYRLAPKTSPPV